MLRYREAVAIGRGVRAGLLTDEKVEQRMHLELGEGRREDERTLADGEHAALHELVDEHVGLHGVHQLLVVPRDRRALLELHAYNMRHKSCREHQQIGLAAGGERSE